MSNPYHVRLAISQYGDRFRAELFTEDLGDTDGELLPADWRERFKQWTSYLKGGGSLPAETSRTIGAQLFEWLLSGTNRLKWGEVLERMKRDPARAIRLLIDSTTATNPGAQDRDVDNLHNLPYGLLFDPQKAAFLFRPREGANQLQYVRIVRRTTPRLLNLAPARWPLRVLLAAAEPDGLEFASQLCLEQLLQGLKTQDKTYAVDLCTAAGPRPLPEMTGDEIARSRSCTREHLRAALQQKSYDLMHVMAHGRGAGLLLCSADRKPVPVDADELSEWCRGKVQLAFLQVCKAARTAGQGAFGGLAQRLINPDGGDLAAVVASPYLLEAEQSTAAALAFYAQLAEGDAPDRALRRDLDMNNFGWAFLELWVRPSALGDSGARGAFQFVSPYKGLSRFEERDAEIFFGRESETAELINIVQSEPVVAVVGDSGSGKSSLLHAGLAPRIRQQGLAGQTGWRIVALKPGDQPQTNLAAALRVSEQAAEETPGNDAELTIEALLSKICSQQPLLILFNQFEEVFTLCKAENERYVVAVALANTAKQYPDRFRLVLDMRSEFGSRAAALPGLTDLIKRPWVLKPPTSADVRTIIEMPALHYGYSFQGALNDGKPGHAQSLLERMLSEPLLAKSTTNDKSEAAPTAPLPLLEFALECLWLKAVDRGSQEFGHADYDELGGLVGAIARHADEVFASLPGRAGFADERDVQHVAELLFTGVVSSRGATHTRRPRVRPDLEIETGNANLASRLIDVLVGERLLTIRSDATDLSRVRIDVAHEVLIEWPKLKGWLQADSATRAVREQFQEDAQQWDEGDPGSRQRRSGRNLPNTDLSIRYLGWIDEQHPSLTEAQQAFVTALRSAVLNTRIINVGSLVIAALLIVTSVLAYFTWNNARDADNKRQRAETAESKVRVLNANVRSLLYDSNLQTIDRARRSNDYAAVLQLLHAAVPDPTADIASASDPRGFEWYYLWNALHQDDGTIVRPLHSAYVSADGRLLIGSGEQRCEVWNTTTGNLVWRSQDSYFGSALSRDGKLLAFLTHSKIKIRNLIQQTDGAELATETYVGGSLHFSPDANYLAYHGKDSGRELLVVWDLRDQSKVEIVKRASFGAEKDKGPVVNDCVWLPDSSALLTAEETDYFTGPGQVTFWNPKDGTPIKTITGHKRGIFQLSVAANGKTLGTLDRDDTLKLWNIEDGKELLSVTALRPWTLSPDGTLLAYSKGTKYQVLGIKDVVVWGIAEGKELKALTFLRAEGVWSLKFTRDNSLLMAADESGKLFSWKVGPLVFASASHEGQTAASEVSIFDDGRLISYGAKDRLTECKVWSSGKRGALSDFATNEKGYHVSDIAVSAEGHRVATAANIQWNRERSYGRTIVWDAEGKNLLTVEKPQTDSTEVDGVRISPNGRFVAIRYSGTAEIWNVDENRKQFSIRGWQFTFHPNGKELISVDLQKLEFWNLESGQVARTLPLLLRKPPDPKMPIRDYPRVSGLELSRNGETVAIAVHDPVGTHEVHLYSSRGDSFSYQYKFEGDGPILFSPDGQLLAFTRKGQVNLWDAKEKRLHASIDPRREKFDAASEVPASFLSFSPDGRRLAVARDSRSPLIVDVATCQGVLTMQEAVAKKVVFLNANTLLGCNADQEAVSRWQAATNQEVLNYHARKVELNPADVNFNLERVKLLWNRTSPLTTDAVVKQARQTDLREVQRILNKIIQLDDKNSQAAEWLSIVRQELAKIE